MSTFGERFSELQEAAGETVAGFAKALRVTRQSVYDWRRAIEPTQKAIGAVLSSYPTVNVKWLEEGTGPMFLEGQNDGGHGAPPEAGEGLDPEKMSRLSDQQLKAVGYVRIPQLALQPTAGEGGFNDVPFQEVNGERVMPEWYARQRYGVDPSRVRELIVRGVSMQPTINPGQVVTVVMMQGEKPAHGAIYLMSGPYGLMIKRLYFEEEMVLDEKSGGEEVRYRVWIWSDNPEAGRHRVPLDVFERDYRLHAYVIKSEQDH